MYFGLVSSPKDKCGPTFVPLQFAAYKGLFFWYAPFKLSIGSTEVGNFFLRQLNQTFCNMNVVKAKSVEDLQKRVELMQIPDNTSVLPYLAELKRVGLYIDDENYRKLIATGEIV